MDLTGVRSEPHVAQQSRREKLRVQQIYSAESRRISDEQQIPLRSEFSPDLVQVRSVHNANSLFDQSFLPSEMTGSCSHPSSSNLNVSSKVHQQASDWILSYGNNPWPAENNQNPAFTGEVANVSVPQPYSRPSYIHDFNFCNDNLPDQDRRKNDGESQFITLPCQNTLQDVIAPATVQTPVPESGQAGWSSAAELHSFPSFRNQEDLLRFENSMNWVDRSAESSGQQGLSLSLSANPLSKPPAAQLEGGHGYEDHNHSVTGKSGCLRSISKPSGISKGLGKSIQEIIGVSSGSCRNTGPLGPFTGYALILKNSKFLKPAQQLLDEICGKSGLSSGKTCDVSETVSVDVFDTIETETSANDYNLPDLRPDVQQKKAKLLHVMEEICRRYRQYNQQMQMVVSSFESVAGLGSATPFMSTALKTVSRQFRCLKDAISDQLSLITKTGGSKVGGNCTRIGGDEPSLEQCGLLQHVWRPQRGLPERSVGVLRAWLFEHFLHPYPTDADKHMLATQTGLSRNQVSNWFINARVRLWKPMVEEIHMLETKASTYANPNQPENPKTTADRQEPPGSDEGPSTRQRWAGQEKRSRVDGEASPSSLEGPLVGFVPYQRSQLGGVSLTLGLRHGVENSQQQIVLERQNQLRRQCGEHYVRDFVG